MHHAERCVLFTITQLLAMLKITALNWRAKIRSETLHVQGFWVIPEIMFGNKQALITNLYMVNNHSRVDKMKALLMNLIKVNQHMLSHAQLPFACFFFFWCFFLFYIRSQALIIRNYTNSQFWLVRKYGWLFYNTSSDCRSGYNSNRRFISTRLFWYVTVSIATALVQGRTRRTLYMNTLTMKRV